MDSLRGESERINKKDKNQIFRGFSGGGGGGNFIIEVHPLCIMNRSEKNFNSTYIQKLALYQWIGLLPKWWNIVFIIAYTTKSFCCQHLLFPVSSYLHDGSLVFFYLLFLLSYKEAPQLRVNPVVIVTIS